VLYKVDLLK